MDCFTFKFKKIFEQLINKQNSCQLLFTTTTYNCFLKSTD